MKTILRSVMMLCIITPFLVTGQVQQSQKTSREPATGKVSALISNKENSRIHSLNTFRINKPLSNILWTASDEGAIPGNIRISPSHSLFCGWYLNNDRCAYYPGDSVPQWEKEVATLSRPYSVSMSQDGSKMAIADGATLKVLTPDGTVSWQKTLDNVIYSLVLSPDGSKIYVVEYVELIPMVKLYSFNVGNDTPNWFKPVDVDYYDPKGLVISGNGDILIFRHHQGAIVYHSDNGNVINTFNYNSQFLPAISADGGVFVIQDANGYIYTYKYKTAEDNYELQWKYRIYDGGEYYLPTIPGLAVSADGSTIVAGTSFYNSTVEYDGQVYVFNTNSDVPLWIFQHLGEQASAVDISSDGSLIAVGTYGPLDNSLPDFYLFRKTSPDPVFTLNTPGSVMSLKMSADGAICGVGVKSVHATAWGMGGTLYKINTNPGGGTLSGNVNLSGYPVQSDTRVAVTDLEDYYDNTNASGNYTVKYVPSGTHSVKASKTGFFPVTQDNVNIQEGNATTLDFTLLPCGPAPVNMTATQGTETVVNLSWEAPSGATPLGYKIYRKALQEGSFPDDPMDQVEAGVLTYIDATAAPFTKYYYAVTCMLENDMQSPYSNTAAGWINTEFITDHINALHGTVPVIDGHMSPEEWSDAYSVDLSSFLGNVYDAKQKPIGSVIGYFKTDEAETNLYIAIVNKNDTELVDNDKVGIYIDDNYDGSFPEPGEDSEGNYTAIYNSSGNYISFRSLDKNGAIGTTINIPDPQIAASVQDGYVTYEFALPIGNEPWMINLTPEKKCGMAIYVKNMPGDFDGWWQYNMTNLFDPSQFGQLNIGNIPLSINPGSIATASVQITPNPVANETTLKVTLESPSKVTLDIYNMNGMVKRHLVNEELGKGTTSIRWNGSDDKGSRLPAGMYFYRLMTTSGSVSGKLIIVN